MEGKVEFCRLQLNRYGITGSEDRKESFKKATGIESTPVALDLIPLIAFTVSHGKTYLKKRTYH